MINNYIKASIKNIFRNKKNINLILIFALLLFLLFIDAFIFKNFFDFYDSSIRRMAGFRTLNVTSLDKTNSEAIKEIKKISHVEDAYESIYERANLFSNINDNNADGWIGLNYNIKSATPKTIKGKKIEELKPGELVCPYEFYPNAIPGNPLEIETNKFLNAESTLNREIIVTYSPFSEKEEKEIYTKTMKIVGLYDETISREGINVCYASLDDIKDIVDTKYSLFTDYSYSLRVVIDKEKNINEVRRKIQDTGRYIVENETSASIDIGYVGTLFTLITIVAIIIITSIIIITINYIKKKLKDESKYLGILRACGYTKKQVITQIIIENTIILSISFIISIFIFYTLFTILNKIIFKYFKYIGFYINNNLILTIVIFIFLLVILETTNYMLINKKMEGTIADNLKEN